MHILKFKPGHGQCPACTLAQRQLEPHTAVFTADDRIFCYNCYNVAADLPHGASYKLRQLPAFLQQLVYGLITFQTDSKTVRILRGPGDVPRDNLVPDTYRLVQVGPKDQGDYAGRGALATGQHAVEYLIEEARRVYIRFGSGYHHGLTVSFMPESIAALEDKSPPDGPAKQPVQPLEPEIEALLKRLQNPLLEAVVEPRAVCELVKAGFRLTSVNMDRIPNVKFVWGKAPKTVLAELEWYV